MASQSLKLSGISHGNCGDHAAVDRGDIVVDIEIVNIFGEKTFEVVPFSD